MELKTDPEVFQAVWEEKKRYEIRFNDRDFQEGDLLTLRETRHSGLEMKTGAPLIYTGREIKVVVTHVLRGPVYGLADGWVIMSINSIARIQKA